MRAANTLSVYLLAFILVTRVLQLIGYITQSESLSKGAYVTATSMICLLFMVDFSKERADIVHEIVPTKDQIIEEMVDFNYNP